MSTLDEIRRYWDVDAATYDDATGHRPRGAAELAAWSTALARFLPPAPARVLDCGAGTGFLSLLAAQLGHSVTALDLSGVMLERLRRRAETAGLEIETVEGSASDPPSGPFDAVMERHLLWTLPDPGEALRAWRSVAPYGRLILIEGVWGGVDRLEAIKSQGRRLLRQLRRQPGDHHAAYDPVVAEALPLSRGTRPSQVVELVSEAGWTGAGLERLRDVEWAAALDLRLPERLLGVAPRFVVRARALPGQWERRPQL